MSVMANRVRAGLLSFISALLTSTAVYSAEPLNLVANPLPTLVAEDNEPARINVLISKALSSIDLPATLHIDRPAFSGSGLLTGKYDGEYAFLSLNDKRNGFLYSNAYLPANRPLLADSVEKVAAISCRWQNWAISQCGDNAACEGVFGILKRERVHHRRYRTRDEARADLFEYIERFHNPRMRRRVAAQDRKLTPVL